MSDRPCNHCIVEEWRETHTVELKPKPMPHFPEGQNVYLDGEFAAWMARIGDTCQC